MNLPTKHRGYAHGVWLACCAASLVLWLGFIVAHASPTDGAGQGTETEGPTAPLRLAVMGVQGRFAPHAGIVDLIIARSSAEAGLELVERQTLDRILAEQSLQGMDDSEAVVRLGQIVGADVFLFVESSGKGEDIRVRYVESRTGMVMLTSYETVHDLADDSTALKRQWALVREKLRVPAKDRRYVSVMSFRSEEPLASLQAWAEAHLRLLESGLDASPSISLVERAQIGHLKGEAELTSTELAIQAASVAIEISVRRLTSETNRLNLVFRYPDGTPSATVPLDLPTGDTLRARQFLLGAVLDTIKAEPPSADSALSSASEAQLFRQRAEKLSAIAPSFIGNPSALFALQPTTHHGRGWNDPEGARQAAEAAYALDPTPSHLFLAASLNLGTQRGFELLHRFWRAKLAAHQAAGRAGTLTNVFDFPLRVPPSQAGTASPRMSEESIRLQRETFAYILQVLAAEGDANKWAVVLGEALHGCRNWCRSPEEWAEYAKFIVALARRPPAPIPSPPHTTPVITPMVDEGPILKFLYHAESCFETASDGYTPYRDSHTPDAVTRALGWMRDSEDASLALCAHLIDFRSGHWTPDLAVRAMKRIRDIPLADPIRQAGDGSLVRCAHGCISLLDKAKLPYEEERVLWDKFYRLMAPIIDEIVAANDVQRLDLWLNYGLGIGRYGWLRVLEHQSPEIALAWLRQADAFFERQQDALPRGFASQRLVNNRKLLQEMADGLVLRTSKATRPPDSSHVMEPLPNLKPYKEARGLMLAAFRRSKLYCVWGIPSTVRGCFNLRITSGPIEGPLEPGPWVKNVHPAFSKLDRKPIFISGIAVTDSMIGLGVGADGLFVFDLHSGSIAGQAKGAPSGVLVALDACRDKIYCWYADQQAPGGWLYRYDPAPPGRFELLASHRSMADDCALNGGDPYDVTGILGDDARGVVWLGIRRGSDRGGLWRFDPQQGTAERVVPSVANPDFLGVDVGTLHWQNDDILVQNSSSCAWLFSPSTKQSQMLLSTSLFDKMLPAYGTSHLPVWLACIMGPEAVSTAGLKGTSRVTGGSAGKWHHISKGEIWIHRRGNGPPIQVAMRPDGKAPNITAMFPLSEREVMLISHDMTFWRLHRTSESHANTAVVRTSVTQAAVDWLRDESVVPVMSTRASSEMVVNGKHYSAQGATDGRADTWWVAAPEPAPAWIELEFQGLTPIHEVVLCGGLTASNGRILPWPHNPLPLAVTFVDDNGNRHECRLHDLAAPQRYRFGKTVTTTSFRLELTGDEGTDSHGKKSIPSVALTEIMFSTPSTSPSGGVSE